MSERSSQLDPARNAPSATGADADEQDAPSRTVRSYALWALACCLLVILVLASLSMGQYSIGPAQIIRAAIASVIPEPSWHLSASDHTVLMQVRLPRVLAAVVVGSALSASGASYQSMFRNPLVSPDILGVSAGTALGASLAIFVNMPIALVQLFAFVGGMVAVGVTLAVSYLVGRGSVIVMVLAGLVVSALASAFISLAQYFANPDTTLPAITFWLFGGLGSVTLTFGSLWLPSALVVVCLSVLFALRWPITVLASDDDDARALGVNRTVVQGVALIATTVAIAAVISMAGIIAWVGLVVPHLARFLVGPRFSGLLGASILIGAAFVLAVDDISRTVIPVQLPLGILTAIIGAPIFIALLAKAREQWQ